MITNVTDSNFNEKVLNSDKPVFVDFWAVWCAPCKMLAPQIETVAKKLEGHIEVAKMDIDANPEVSEKYGITSIPTMILFDKGKPALKLVGFRPSAQIEAFIKEELGL